MLPGPRLQPQTLPGAHARPSPAATPAARQAPPAAARASEAPAAQAGSRPDRDVDSRHVGAEDGVHVAGNWTRQDAVHTAGASSGTGHGGTSGTTAGGRPRQASGTAPGRRPGKAVRRGTLAAGRRRGRRKVWAGAAVTVTLLAGLGGAWLLGGGSIPELFAAFHASAAGTGGADGSDASGAGGPSRGEGTARTPAPAASAVPRELRDLLESADPEQAVRGLAALRSLAFSSGDFSLLDAVNAPESAAAAADLRIRTQLSGSGHVLAGFSTSLTRIETTADSSPARAVVAITAASSAYQELDGGGNVVGGVPAAAAQQLQLVLVSVDGRWRIQDVLPPGREAG